MINSGNKGFISSSKSQVRAFNIFLAAIVTSCVSIVTNQAAIASEALPTGGEAQDSGNISSEISNVVSVSIPESTQRDYFNIQEDGTFNYHLENFNLENVYLKEVAESGDKVLGIGEGSNQRYYAYSYKSPENYKNAESRIPSLSSSVENLIFENFSTSGHAGAILNTKSGSYDITADFINNFSVGGFSSAGGAIYNEYSSSRLGNISGNFIGNYVETSYASGAAIRNDGKISFVQGNFINNHTKSGMGGGGTVYNADRIDKINANFIANSAIAGSLYAYGAGIYNQVNIDELTGDFIANRIISTGDKTYGGAIWSPGNIGKLTGNFIYNSASAYRESFGGAIYNNGGTFKDVTANFIGNSASSSNSSSFGGAINITGGTIEFLSGTFIDNTVLSNSNEALGGAIYNSNGKFGKKDSDGNINGGIVNSNFVGNHAVTKYGTAQGGAIWTNKDLNIIADNGTSIFKDNYTQAGDERDDNAIYLNNADRTLNFQLKNGGQIAMYDNIRGAVRTSTETDSEGNEVVKITDAYKINIQGDDLNKTTFYMLNDMYDANLTVGNTTLNTVNNDVHTYNFNTFSVSADTNFVADVDLAKAEMDRFTAGSYGEHHGNLNVAAMNLLSDAPEGQDKTEVFFAENGLKNNVTTTVEEVAYSPIYKYRVSYENRDDAGYFVFNRGNSTGGTTGNGGNGGGGTGGNPSNSFNPAVLSAPTANVAATQATVNETFKYVFEHADAFTQMPAHVRHASLNANKYAISTDFNNNLGELYKNNSAGWFRPYVTFENMHLKHGPKVDAITYGSLAGFDTDFHEHKRGWHSVGTGYIGYNGNTLHYQGVDTTMNGGLLGYTHTMYKNNFWTALTLSAGASVGESRTMYGKEDFTSLMAGVGSKTGYNFEFKEGKYILQPIMFMSYTFANTFDYTNAAGVKIKPSPAHSIQLNPSVRFIANTKNGWQPYASVGMVWNVMNENKVTANSVRLPEMGMKPYVEYGLGIQRNWKDRFTAFGQAMIRNGGRTGIALTGGFRCALGKEGKAIDKVQAPAKLIPAPCGRGSEGEGVNTAQVHNQISSHKNFKILNQVQNDKIFGSQGNRTISLAPRGEGVRRTGEGLTGSNGLPRLAARNDVQPTKTVLKQLSPAQKTALGKRQNTTRTTSAAVLRAL